MKKITLLLVFFLAIVSTGYGQCLDATSTTPLYPTATYTPATCDGTTLNSITTAGYASEYSNVNVTLGETYTFTSSVATDFITIGSEDGLNAIVFGENGTLTWIADLTGVVRFYTHLDNACGAENVNRIRGVICGAPPTCPKPLNVAVASITTNSADFTWDAGGSETAWEILILPNGDPAPDDSTIGTPVAAVIYTETTLTSSTAYQFYVRASCGAGDLSQWTLAVNFVTPCEPFTTLPWTEGFEDIVTVGTTAFPLCWSEQNGDWASAITGNYNTPRTGVNYIRNSWSATNEFMWSPGFQLNAGVNYDFSFFAQGDGYSGWAIDVFSSDAQDSANATQFGSTYSPVGANAASIQPYNKVRNTFTPPTDGIYYFAVRVNQPSGAPWYVAFDDFKLELTPSCVEPSALVVADIIDASATVSWTEPITPPVNGYQYYISEDATNPDAGTVPTGAVAAGVLTYDLTNLTSSTTYNIWVRSACAAGETSEWSSKLMFTTTCAPIATLPWTEGFEDIVTVGTTAFPLCWSEQNGDWASAITGNYNTPRTGVNYIRNSWSATNEFMWSPGFQLNAGVNYDFSFFAQGDGYSGWAIDVFSSDAQDSANAIQFGSTYSPVGANAASIQPYNKVRNTFTPSTDGIYYFAVRVNQPSGAPWYVAFDDFKLELTPSCVEPSALVVADLTEVAATVSWTESITTPSNGFEYYISEDISAPEATTTPTGTVGAGVLTYNFTGLTANTTYYVWVRSACSGGTSEWSSMVTFKTNCGSLTSFFENFDAALTLPDCWSKVGTFGTSNVQASGVAPSAPNVLYIYGTSAANQPVVAMPAVSNAGSATNQLKFKAKANFTIGGVIEVGYLTNSSDATSFVSLQSFTTTSTSVFDSFTANLGTEPGSNQVIAFRHSGVPANSVLIDDVSWEPIPTTAPNCTIATATPNDTCGNSATIITWEPVAGVDGYNLTIGTTAGGTDIVNNEPIGDVTTYSFEGSFNSTYYFTVTPFNAFGSATGCAEQSFTTFVDGCYCISNPTSNDNNGITNVQLGTVDFPNGDVTYADYTSTPVDLGQGLSTNLQASFATGFTYDTNIWIDFNNDFNFDDSELVKSGTSLATNPTVLDLTFTMPSNAALGTHRMRLGAADSGQAIPNPCYSGTWGVTIDFSVNIIIPTCTPASVVSSTVVDDCANNQYFVSVEVSSLGNGTPSITDGITTYPITAIGTIQAGPFVSGTSTSLTLLHGIETICDLPLGIFSSICPPANDECFTATPMVITGDFDSSAVVWNNTGGTNNPNNPLPTCEALNFAATGKDVWFQSNAPESGSVIVETRGNGGLTDTGFAVYTGDCDNLVLGACDADGGTGLFSLFSFTGLTPGQPLYIRLWGYNGASGSALVGCYDASLLNANAFDNKNFTYYPNPVKDVLNLSYTKNISSVAVFNLLGQQIATKVVNANQSKIDMSNLASGTYIVKVTSDNQIKTIKVIKE